MATQQQLLAQLLSPALAQQSEQQRLQAQALATAESRNPLLAEAGRTANMMRGSLGSLFGTDLRSAQQRVADQAKQIIGNTNLSEEQKIQALKQVDPRIGAAYEQQVLATKQSKKALEDKFTIEKLPFGDPNPFTGKRPERAAVIKNGQFVRWLGEGETTQGGSVTVEPEQQETAKTAEDALREQLRAQALEAQKTGRPIKLPSGQFAIWDSKQNKWVPFTPPAPDIQGDLGVQP